MAMPRCICGHSCRDHYGQHTCGSKQCLVDNCPCKQYEPDEVRRTMPGPYDPSTTEARLNEAAKNYAKRAVPRKIITANLLEESILTDDELIDIITKATNMLNNRSNKKMQAGIQQKIADEKAMQDIPMYGLGPQVQAADVQEGRPKLHISESGATSSHVPLRYDIIPRQLIECAAARYTLGAQIHGERNYQKGLTDRKQILNRINHIQEHWSFLLHPSPIQTDDGIYQHIGAMLWGLGFLLEVMSHSEGGKILSDIIANGAIKF